MQVICYSNKTLGGKNLDSLTLNKIYDVIQQYGGDNWICKITDDRGQQMWYNSEVVMPLDKWRELQFGKLGL
jgi:hypothetical protein